ncbi:MAG: type II secretion system F family protein [Phycisphaerales bacterium]|jgi:type IV pilus assembly protein PilC
MKSYRYVVRDSTGAQKKGLAQASSSTDVLSHLREKGFTPISIDEISGSAIKNKRLSHRKRIKSAELSALCWQLTTMVEGGIPITVALDTIAEDTGNSYLQHVLESISERVKKGKAFSESMSEFPKIFNQLACALILAGETGGNLGEALRKLAEHFDSRDKLTRKVKGAMAYPIFVLSFIIVIVIFIMAFIVPRFRMIFEQLGGQLPAFTRGFMYVYDILQQNIIYAIGLLVLLITSSILACKTQKGHTFFSKISLSIPLLGKVFHQAFIATFCRTMSTLLSAGVSVLEVFDVLKGMTNNDVIKSAIINTRESLVGGSNISLSMGATNFFPNMVIKMVQVGEESGSLPIVLERTSEHYERKVDSTVTTLTNLLEPIMIVSVGAVVSVVVIALYLPIFSMSNVSG